MCWRPLCWHVAGRVPLLSLQLTQPIGEIRQFLQHVHFVAVDGESAEFHFAEQKNGVGQVGFLGQKRGPQRRLGDGQLRAPREKALQPFHGRHESVVSDHRGRDRERFDGWGWVLSLRLGLRLRLRLRGERARERRRGCGRSRQR